MEAAKLQGVTTLRQVLYSPPELISLNLITNVTCMFGVGCTREQWAGTQRFSSDLMIQLGAMLI
jgi:hypothetical protein